jgi:hypothetical protein
MSLNDLTAVTRKANDFSVNAIPASNKIDLYPALK